MNKLIKFNAVVIIVFLFQCILFSSVFSFTEFKFIGDTGIDRDSNIISSVDPKQNEINVVKSSDIVVTFGQSMNASTITSSNIKIFGSQTGLLSYSLSYNPGTRTATINPNNDFKIGEKITVTLKSGIQNSTGTAITPYIFSFTTQAVSGEAEFSISQNPVIVSGDIKGLISGDLDSDGDPDVCVIFTNKFSILKNNGSAVFTGQTDYSLSNLSGTDTRIGDFDGDGDLDLALITVDFTLYRPDIHIYNNNGSGIFTLYATLTGKGGETMTTGDYDSDGDLDIITADGITSQLGYVKMLKNNGSGDFNLVGTDGPVTCCPVHGSIYYTYFGNINLNDYDNDGDMDYILNGGSENFDFNCSCNFFGLTNSPIYGGVAGFSINPPNFSYFINSEDINGDRKLDIIVSPGHIYKNTNSNFSLTSYPGLGGNVLTSDFDGDGDMDIAELNLNQVNIYKNNGTGSFTAYSSTANSLSGSEFTSGDFDGDGDIDIIAASESGTDLSILKNGACTPPICGITGADTVITGATNLIYLGSTQNAYWEISNFDITGASILPGQSGDSVKISAGQNGGHFVLYYVTPVCGTYPSCSKHIYVVNPNAITCTIYSVMEGFYNVSLNKLNMRDTVRAYLRNVNSPYNIVDYARTVIDSVLFGGSFTFMNAPTGTYYIVLKHRNGLETWSESGGISLTKGGLNYYDFTSSQTQAYGNNLVLKGAKYCLFSGDVNQNGIIDLTDIVLIYNDVSTFASGYINSDLNGDRIADLSDIVIAYNNSSNFVSLKRP